MALTVRDCRARAAFPGRCRIAAAVAASMVLLVLPGGPMAEVAHARGGPQSVAPVAEKLFDAVVNISTSQTVKGSGGVPLPKVPKGSPFEEFFDEFFNKKGGRPQQDRKFSSLGSGFVIDPSGLIVTNHHVIDGADEIVISFNDGTKLKVEKVLGKDSKTDLALLKVTPKRPLAAVKFGSSTTLRVGDWVMAIGNPFGLGGSLTVGVISAKQRDINSGPYDDYLQTDAAINKGNSGGPLFNMDGDVIGVNTAIISPSGGSIGIGFAVPSDTAVAVIEQLKLHGETRRGWLGVQIQTVTEDLAEGLGLSDPRGALVARVTPKGPAAEAGLESGDVILRFDGKDVTSMRGLPRIVAQTPIGREAEVEYLRKGERRKVMVRVGRLEEGDKEASAAAKDQGEKSSPRKLLGLSLEPLNDEHRKRFGLDKKIKGAVVTEVDPMSPSAQKGLKPGDVIVEVAQEEVSGPDDVVGHVDKARKAGRKSVLFLLADAKGEVRFVALPLSE